MDMDNENGIEGAKVTGPNGNSIFLPASGVYDDYAGWGGKWRDKNKTGFYLTKSMVLRNDSVGHYRLMFSEKTEVYMWDVKTVFSWLSDL